MVLLTGASGFIGSHFVDRASPLFPLRCLARPSSAIKMLPRNGVEIMEGDILSERSVAKAMEGDVDAVIHLAALVRKNRPADIRRVNIEGTRLLVLEAKKKKIRRFIFVSTENTLREDLNDAYAVSKREAESIVQTFENHVILRPCFVYGHGDNHGLGRLMALAQKKTILPLFGNLQSQIQPIHIDDMVEYLIRCVRMDVRGSYLIAGPEEISLNDFLKKVCALTPRRRILMPLPYAVLKLSALIAGGISPSSGWGVNQLNNIYNSRTYSIEKTVKDFCYMPRGINEGLEQWLSIMK